MKNRLSRPVDKSRDHILGPAEAEITLVEYGGYVCPHCRAVHGELAELKEAFGDRLRYIFRHRPIPGSELALRAAELVEMADEDDAFWKAHFALMSRSRVLSEDDLEAVAREHGWPYPGAQGDGERAAKARARVQDDIDSARESSVNITPTFFINGRRYDGPWDKASLGDAMERRIGHRVRTAALDFAAWGPSAGILLLLASLAAVAFSNSPMSGLFISFWEQELGFTWGENVFRLSLSHWINNGLLTIFFLVVGLEIKREFTVGHLASLRAASFPIAAAIGGMVVPALLYLAFIPDGPWRNGWGVPMATDTAFAIALIAMLGRRVPVELRIILTAAAIVDDIGAILVVAVFYSESLSPAYLGAAVLIIAALVMLNFSRVYRLFPFLALGILLWVCIYASGLHATLAGVLLALFIPTRPPPHVEALRAQADQILKQEGSRQGEHVSRHRLSLTSLQALDDIHDRLESPAARLLRKAGARSSYVVLPLFALANAGVAVTPGIFEEGHAMLTAAIFAGLVIGKPLGLVASSVLAVKLNLTEKPDAYSWRQVMGAGALAGIGFTMSLFIAGQAFPVDADFQVAKLAIFAASLISALIGLALLMAPERTSSSEQRS